MRFRSRIGLPHLGLWKRRKNERTESFAQRAPMVSEDLSESSNLVETLHPLCKSNDIWFLASSISL